MKTTQQIKAEIQQRLGFVPPFFEPAFETPAVLDNLWQQTLASYLDNPIPNLFKEKLAALLARYCAVPYCLMCHSASLRPLGMSGSEVLTLLRAKPLSFDELIRQTRFPEMERVDEWPPADSELDVSILHCSVAIFLNQDTDSCQQKLRAVLSPRLFDFLNVYIAYNRTCLSWAEAHPELRYQDDPRVRENYADLIREDHGLVEFFENYQSQAIDQAARRSYWLTQENHLLIEKERTVIRERDDVVKDLVDTLESMSDAFFSIGADWKINHVNAHMEPITGLTRQQILGRDPRDVWFSEPEHKFSQYWLCYHQTMTERVPTAFVEHYAPLDLWTQVRAYPKSDGGMAVFFSNITAQKKNEDFAQFEKQKLEIVFRESPAAMVLWRGADLIFEKINERFQAIFPGRELLGQPFLEAVPEAEGQPFVPLLRQVFETGESAHFVESPVQIFSPKKEILQEHFFDFSYTRVSSPDGSAYGVYCHAIDVTERVLGRRELEKAKFGAEQASRIKSAFLANMSHEIRTPLGAILGFTDLLKEPETKAEDRQYYLDIISRNGKSLTRLIDDILDLSKVEAGKLNVEAVPVHLREMLDDVRSLFQDKIRLKKIGLAVELSRDCPETICTDPTRLRQILINIVGNAVKFTETGGISIMAEVASREESRCQIKISIKDTGRGLTSAQQKNLFSPFVQGDSSTTREFGGTGLGLALSRRLANALGGDVVIENCEEKRGCTFAVSFVGDLPASRPREELKLSPADGNGSNLIGVRVLLVEDAPDNQILIKKVLTKAGAETTVANNGLDGVNRALAGSFDVVLMDIQMPVMDGYEAIAELRKHSYEVPIVALTAHAMDDERLKTRRAGFASHLTKPINRADLLQAVREQSSRHRAPRAIQP